MPERVAVWAAVTLVATALVLLIIAPASGIFTAMFEGEDGAPSLERWRQIVELRSAAGLTLGITVASVLAALVIGLALALVVSTCDMPGRRILGGLLLLPLTLPPLVGALSTRAVFGELGILPGLLASAGMQNPPALSGWGGVVLVHALTMYPIVYAFALAGLSRVDASQLEAARVHGASRLTVFTRVLLPALRPALAAAAALVAMTSLASFTAPHYWKTDGDYLTQVVYKTRVSDPDRAIAATFVLGVLAMVLLALFMAIEGKTPAPAGQGTPRPLARGGSRARSIVATAGILGFLLVALMPQAAIVLLGLAESWGAGELVPRRYSLASFRALFADPDLSRPLVASGLMSVAAVLAAGSLGLIAAWWRRRLTVPGGGVVELLCMLPFALPGTVLGLAMLRHFNEPWAFGLAPALASTVFLLPLAYAVRVLPLCYRGASAALAAVDPRTEEAAALLGASPAWRMWRVVAPAIAPGVAAAALLAFLTAVGELPASIMLYTPENLPVAVKIDTLFRHTRYGRPFAYATLLVACQIGVLLLAAWLSGRRARRALGSRG